MPLTPEITKLEDSIRVYSDAIESFERARERMLNRRKGAIDSVMVHIEHSLDLNKRTLESLRSVLDTAKKQLDAERLRET